MGRVEYTPLGLDDYWSMVSNGKLFIWLLHHILNIHFSENISTIYPCIHWPVVRKWTHKFMSYITKQETFQWNSSTAHPNGSHVGIQNTESLLSTLIVTDHQCYRAIKSLQTTVHSNTIDTYNTGPRITNVIATRRKNFSQRERSFIWKLRCQWPKPPRRAAKTPATQDPGAHVTNAKRPLTKSPQQKARLWLADAKASPNHSQKLPAKSP